MVDSTTYISLSSLFQEQGESEPVNTSGIVVATDEDNLLITDWSRRDVTPIRVESDAFSVKSRSKVSKYRNIETERVIEEGDYLLLRGFFVWFDLEREGLPLLRNNTNDRDQAGTWCVWRYGSDHCIECNRTIGASELQKMSKLHSWWCSNRKVDK